MKILSAAFAFTILLMTGLTFVPSANAQNILTYFDNFEDDVVSQDPLGDFYTATANTNVIDTVAYSGERAVDIEVQQSSFTGLPDFCYSGTTSARVYLTALPSAGGILLGYGHSTTANTLGDVMALYISPTTLLALIATFDGSAHGASIAFSETFPLNEWVLIEYSGQQCHGSTSDLNDRHFTVCVTGATFDECQYIESTTGNNPGANFLPLTVFGSLGGSVTCAGCELYIDDLSLNGIYKIHPNDSSITGLTNVVGFDLPPAASHFVLRHGSPPSTVSVYDGTSLVQTGTASTNCNRVGAVMALQDGIAYLNCDGSLAVESIIFASNSMGNYAPLEQDTIVLTSLTGENEYSYIKPWKTLFSTTTQGSTIGKDLGFFAVGNDNNLYGIGLLQSFNGVTVTNDLAETSVAYGAIADDLCGDYSQDFFVVDTSGTTKGYTYNHLLTGATDINTPTLTSIFTGSAAINSAFDIDCSVDKIIVGKGENVHVIRRADGATLWNLATTDLIAVASSLDGKWATFIAEYNGTGSTDVGYIVNMTTGAFRGYFEVPTGTIMEMKMDEFGQVVYTQTTTAVYKSVIYEATTVVPISSIPEETGTSTVTNTGGGGFVGGTGEECTGTFLGINISFIANSWSTTDTAIRWLLGLLLLSLIVWGFSKTGSAFLIIIAIILGTGIGIVFCLFPVWLLLVEIFVLVLAVGKMIFSGNNGE